MTCSKLDMPDVLEASSKQGKPLMEQQAVLQEALRVAKGQKAVTGMRRMFLTALHDALKE